MSLLIAWMVIAGLDLHWILYPVALGLYAFELRLKTILMTPPGPTEPR